MSTDFLTVLNQIKNIKKFETTLPIAKKAANVIPLMVGDDLSLRSSLTSPAGYDREIIQLLYNKVEFIHEEKTYKENFDVFCSQISNIDKIVLLLSLYKCTYESLGSRNLTCTKCKDSKNKPFPFKETIAIEDLLQEDSLKMWSEDIPFHEYTFPIEIKYADEITFKFSTMLPSIARYNKVLGLVSTQQLQNNLDKLGEIFSKPMQLTLLTSQIEIIKDNQSSFANSLQEIIMAFDGNIPEVISEDFYKQYNDKFNEYLPKFYKKIKCPNCGFEFNYDVDVETEFFRRSVLGGESSK